MFSGLLIPAVSAQDSDKEDGSYSPVAKRGRTSPFTQFPPTYSGNPGIYTWKVITDLYSTLRASSFQPSFFDTLSFSILQFLRIMFSCHPVSVSHQPETPTQNLVRLATMCYILITIH